MHYCPTLGHQTGHRQTGTMSTLHKNDSSSFSLFLAGFRFAVCSFCSHFPAFSADLLSIYFLLHHVFPCFPFPFYMLKKYPLCLPSWQRIPGWNRLLIEKSGKRKKKRFPQPPWRGCPFNCSVCLPASWLYSASTHSATSINASCYAATVYTPPCLARVTLPRPVNISCVHHPKVIRVGFTDG